jgi:hypothetical protein
VVGLATFGVGEVYDAAALGKNLSVGGKKMLG